jgi:(S)-6-hydroxynicotine oxidase
MKNQSSPAEISDNIDVIVIGAGLAGLTAARDLGERGLSVLVVEARDRIGGRTFARSVAGTTAVVDFGGTWVRPAEHPTVMAELSRYQIGTTPTPAPTRFITELNGTLSTKAFLSDREVGEITGAYSFLSRHVDDDTTTEDALRGIGLDPELHAWITATERFLSGSSLSELSAIDSARIPSTDIGDPDHYSHTIDGTTQALVDALAANTNASLLLDTTITIVRKVHGGYELADGQGHTLTSEHVVLAVPLNVLGRIDIQPAIPEVLDLGRTGHAGHSVKMWITVRGVTGWPRILSANGPIAYARLERHLDTNTSLLVGFSDDPALADTTASELQIALGAYLPEIDVIAVDTHDWNRDSFSMGTWMAPRPHQIKRASALTNPQNTNGIHVAGADFCVDAYGTIEGAIASGKRAAVRIIDALSISKTSHASNGAPRP